MDGLPPSDGCGFTGLLFPLREPVDASTVIIAVGLMAFGASSRRGRPSSLSSSV